MKTIIFTDLDGTFLNHDDYLFSESKDALSYINQQNIPLIFTTSKTRKEVEILQKEVGIKEPFIIENGAALFIPKNYRQFDFSFLDTFENYHILTLGVPYLEVVSFYKKHKTEFELFGFSDMSLEQVAKETGLPISAIENTKNRDFTEPFIIKDENKITDLEILAQKEGLKITKGGRFYHLIGEKQDKGKAVKACVEIFEKLFKTNLKSIGLGDGNNDIPLLESVTTPIAIQNHHGKYIEVNKVQKSSYKGAKGWNEMILKNIV